MLLQACSLHSCQAFETPCRAQRCFGSSEGPSRLDMDRREALRLQGTSSAIPVQSSSSRSMNISETRICPPCAAAWQIRAALQKALPLAAVLLKLDELSLQHRRNEQALGLLPCMDAQLDPQKRSTERGMPLNVACTRRGGSVLCAGDELFLCSGDWPLPSALVIQLQACLCMMQEAMHIQCRVWQVCRI